MDYERKFEALSRFASYFVDAEERKVRRFERGLKPKLRKLVSMIELKTYSVVLQKAQILAKDDELSGASNSKERVQSFTQKKSWSKSNDNHKTNKWQGKKRPRS